MASKPASEVREAIDALSAVTDFDAETIKALAEAGTLITVPARWSVIFEQTPADKAYILLDGEVEIRKGGETIATLGAGAVLGEIALVNNQLRSASAIAVTRIKALHFTDEAFGELIAQNPGFAQTLTAAAEARLSGS